MNPDLILASGSAGRQSMLRAVGLDFRAIPADIDETGLIEKLNSKGKNVEEIALRLASEKALTIESSKEAFVIGSDQLLIFENKIFEKSKDSNDTKTKLKQMVGKTHTLISAVCVVQGGEMLWSHCETATLIMRNLDGDFIEDYCAAADDSLLNCVGGYALEQHGAWLFDKVEGDIFTIMGMPLLPLLGFLKEQGFRP